MLSPLPVTDYGANAQGTQQENGRNKRAQGFL